MLAMECIRSSEFQKYSSRVRAHVSSNFDIIWDFDENLCFFYKFQESSITEAVEKQLQGAMQSPPQPSLTPQMMKKPQMGTQATSHQHEPAITPISGTFLSFVCVKNV